jgi:hypothetical protein
MLTQHLGARELNSAGIRVPSRPAPTLRGLYVSQAETLARHTVGIWDLDRCQPPEPAGLVAQAHDQRSRLGSPSRQTLSYRRPCRIRLLRPQLTSLCKNMEIGPRLPNANAETHPVTLPSDADDTSRAYFAITPDV